MPPSELLRVDCPWCAYCLDEALLVREVARDRRLSDEADERAERERQKLAHSEAARTGVPVGG